MGLLSQFYVDAVYRVLDEFPQDAYTEADMQERVATISSYMETQGWPESIRVAAVAIEWAMFDYSEFGVEISDRFAVPPLPVWAAMQLVQ